MKLGKVWELYSDRTEILSNNSRTVGLAAAGVCWFFKTPEVTFPPLIYAALGAVVLFFILDLSQYAVAAIGYRNFGNSEEERILGEGRKLDAEEEVDLPDTIDEAPHALLWVKIGCLGLSFLLIGIEVLLRAFDCP